MKQYKLFIFHPNNTEERIVEAENASIMRYMIHQMAQEMNMPVEKFRFRFYNDTKNQQLRAKQREAGIYTRRTKGERLTENHYTTLFTMTTARKLEDIMKLTGSRKGTILNNVLETGIRDLWASMFSQWGEPRQELHKYTGKGYQRWYLVRIENEDQRGYFEFEPDGRYGLQKKYLVRVTRKDIERFVADMKRKNEGDVY